MGTEQYARRVAPIPRLRGAEAARQRQRITELRPLCPMCKTKGITTPGTELDHIKPRVFGGNNSDDNMQLLCRPCHDDKTADELGWLPRGTGTDGWPTNHRHPLGPKHERPSVVKGYYTDDPGGSS
jgi:5-methylcytosine-specific restriction endonuclease McrA